VEASFSFEVLANTESPVVIDVGANIGTYATWMARWLEPRGGEIYCFEPQRPIFQILCGNFAINNLFNAHAYELAVGKEEGIIETSNVDYSSGVNSFGAFTLSGAALPPGRINKLTSVQRIKMTTLDRFVDDYKLPKVDFIKIDAEGLDLDVIQGAQNVINRFAPDLFVEYLNLGSTGEESSSAEGYTKLVQVLSEMNYKCVCIGHDVFASVNPETIDRISNKS
jgi:FkbM family methyltransferase